MPRAKTRGARRIVATRPPGIPEKSRASFWRGERAEKIVAARAEQYAAERAARPARRSRGESSGDDSQRERRPRSPHAQLRRLERALARRKTLAARQRVKQRIAELREQLGC